MYLLIIFTRRISSLDEREPERIAVVESRGWPVCRSGRHPRNVTVPGSSGLSLRPALVVISNAPRFRSDLLSSSFATPSLSFGARLAVIPSALAVVPSAARNLSQLVTSADHALFEAPSRELADLRKHRAPLKRLVERSDRCACRD